MPDPADYPFDYELEGDDETPWDAASACLGMIGVYLLVSCLIVLIIILSLQMA